MPRASAPGARLERGGASGTPGPGRGKPSVGTKAKRPAAASGSSGDTFDVVTFQTPSVSSDLELTVLRAVLQREHSVGVIRDLLRLAPNRKRLDAIASTQRILADVRSQTCAVVEALVEWRRRFVRPQPFVWKGKNYLLWLTVSTDFLDRIEPLVVAMRFHLVRNPFAIPAVAAADEDAGAPGDEAEVDAAHALPAAGGLPTPAVQEHKHDLSGRREDLGGPAELKLAEGAEAKQGDALPLVPLASEARPETRHLGCIPWSRIRDAERVILEEEIR